ncbi:MAG: CRISPR-associated CARF protein Csa3 [Candidatus Bathyarchaeia archaeon]
MIGRLIIATVGFEEKFIVRFMISSRLGIESEDLLLLTIPITSDSRSRETVEIIKKLSSDYDIKLRIEVLNVDINYFWFSVGKIRRTIEDILSKFTPREVIVLLSGGMRALILETLVGCFLTGLKGRVVVHREDSEGYVEFPLEVLKMVNPPTEHRKALDIIRRSLKEDRMTLKMLAERLGTSKASAYRIVRELKNLGLVEVEHKGRASRITLTEKSQLFL